MTARSWCQPVGKADPLTVSRTEIQTGEARFW